MVGALSIDFQGVFEIVKYIRGIRLAVYRETDNGVSN